MSISVELKEIKRKLETLESMIRLILEKRIPEDEPLTDEIEAIESEDELISLEEAKKMLENEGGG